MAQAITHHGFHDHTPASHPDPARIGALGATMALNLGALLVLAMPMQGGLTRQALAPPTPPPIVDIVPRPLPPPLPPMPRRPEPARPAPATTTPVAVPQPPVVVEQGATTIAPSLPSPPDAVQAQATEAVDAGAVGGSPTALRYVEASAPPYPRAAMRAGLTGTVWLRVLVDERGRPLRVEVEQGSGHRVLDAAAQRHVLAHWRFEAAMDGLQPVQAWGRVPIEFTLGR